MKLLKNLCQRFFQSKLITGSLVMAGGTLVGGIGGYVYHLLMGRMLGPTDYGILASLISLVYLLGIPLGVLNLVVVKFVSGFKGKKDFDSIGSFFRIVNRKILIFALLFLLLFLALTPLMSSFLHLNSFLPILLVLGFFFISIFLMINRSFLQGLLKFGYFSSSSVLESGLKLVFAFLLVLVGWKIYGALSGFLAGGLVALIFTYFPLWGLRERKNAPIKIKKEEIFKFALPVFFSTLAFTSLFSSDLILVRHFFPSEQAGFYAALSTLGRIIYFLAYPVILVMFPMISERYEVGTRYKNLLLASLVLVFAIGFSITGVYFLLPRLIIRLFFGSQYLSASASLGFFGLFLSFYSLALLLNNFFLSIQRTKLVFLPMVAAFGQIVFIYFFHQNLRQIIFISLLSSALLFFILLLFLMKGKKKAKTLSK